MYPSNASNIQLVAKFTFYRTLLLEPRGGLRVPAFFCALARFSICWKYAFYSYSQLSFLHYSRRLRQKSEPVAEEIEPQKYGGALKKYELKGEVTRLDAENKIATIKHEPSAIGWGR